MIKKGLPVIVIAVILCMIPSLTLADVKISLKLQGGLSYLQAGDVNAGTQAFFDWGKIYFAPPLGGLIEGGYTAKHWGYEFGGDIIFELNRNIGIGIGAGYLQMSRIAPHFMMRILDDPQGGTGFIKNFTAGMKLSAIPIRVGLFLSLPFSRKIDFTANTGISYYLKAEYHAVWYATVEPVRSIFENPSQKLSTTAEKRTAPIGFQGGVGIEYKLIHNIAVFAEAQGRYARFGGFGGTSTSVPGDYGGVLPSFSETGKLYYESVPLIPNGPRLIMVQSTPPAGQPREAVVDFSGASLQAGIRIHF
jgi:hypothetical protein